jgi:hypothetical protein
VCTIILALFLRTYHLASAPPGLYPDEAMEGNNALEALSTGQFKIFYPENNGREGLFVAVQAIFLWFSRVITGHTVNEPWLLRLPSALIGTLTVLGIYFLARELFADAPTPEGNVRSRRYGLLAAFLLATSTWHLIFSREGFRAILAPLMLVWALFFILRAMRELRYSERWKSALPWMTAGAVTYALGFYTYIAFRLTPILLFPLRLFGTVHFTHSGEKHLVKQFALLALLFGAVTLVIVSPLGAHFLSSPADLFGRSSEASQISVWSAPHPWTALRHNIALTFMMFFRHGDGNWRHNIAGAAELWWPVAILFALGLLLCIYRLVWTRKTPLRYILCLSLLVVGTAPAFLTTESLPHALRSILALPAAILIATLGGIWVYDIISKWSPRFVLRTITVVFVAVVSLHAYMWYFHDWAPRQEVQDAFATNYVAIGRLINALPADLPKYVTVQPSSVDVRGIPVRAQTTMFITDTFLPEGQAAKNVHYVLPGAVVPQAAVTFELP